jgi:DNA polymerase III epsilon subunit-like protein
MLFDDNTYDMYEIGNHYIKTAPADKFTQGAIDHTGITPDICAKQGIDIVDALYQFLCAWTNCKNVIGHNIEFDLLVVTGELRRNSHEICKRYPAIEPHARMFMIYREEYIQDYKVRKYRRLPKPTCCTMFKTWIWCAAPFPSGRKGIKYPSLTETYTKLFREAPPEPLHNAIVDSLACLRCYLKYVEGKDIHNVKFAHMLAQGFALGNIATQD